jgi:hypothetical protein
LKPKISDFEIEFQAVKPSVHLRSGGLCEAKHFAQTFAPHETEALEALRAVKCSLLSTNTHHRKYRSRGGTNRLSNLLDLCDAHHSFIHANGGFDGPANKLRLALSAGESEEL